MGKIALSAKTNGNVISAPAINNEKDERGKMYSARFDELEKLIVEMRKENLDGIGICINTLKDINHSISKLLDSSIEIASLKRMVSIMSDKMVTLQPADKNDNRPGNGVNNDNRPTDTKTNTVLPVDRESLAMDKTLIKAIFDKVSETVQTPNGLPVLEKVLLENKSFVDLADYTSKFKSVWTAFEGFRKLIGPNNSTAFITRSFEVLNQIKNKPVAATKSVDVKTPSKSINFQTYAIMFKTTIERVRETLNTVINAYKDDPEFMEFDSIDIEDILKLLNHKNQEEMILIPDNRQIDFNRFLELLTDAVKAA
jgi:hypothetical protein